MATGNDDVEFADFTSAIGTSEKQNHFPVSTGSKQMCSRLSVIYLCLGFHEIGGAVFEIPPLPDDLVLGLDGDTTGTSVSTKSMPHDFEALFPPLPMMEPPPLPPLSPLSDIEIGSFDLSNDISLPPPELGMSPPELVSVIICVHVYT